MSNNRPVKARNFCVTWNNYPSHYMDVLHGLGTRYFVAGREGGSGTPHLQVYLQFENARSLTNMIYRLPSCHVEVAHGSPKQCIDYCKKEGSFEEWGTFPRGTFPPSRSASVVSDPEPLVGPSWNEYEADDEVSGLGPSVSTVGQNLTRRANGLADRLRVLDILKENNYDANEVYRVDKMLYASQYVFIERICKAEKQQLHSQTPRTFKTRVVLCTGPPGSGKTRYALRRMKGLACAVYTKDTSEWWPGYRQQPVVFFDEYNDWFPWHHLLRLMSQLPETVPVKNSQAEYNARHLFITTHRSPDTWYKNVQGFDLSALMDRVDEWRVFEKTDAGEYLNTLQKNYRNETRLFETIDDLEPLVEDDQDTTRCVFDSTLNLCRKRLHDTDSI